MAGAAALTVVAVVGGLGSLAARPGAVGPAGGAVPDGAIPSTIDALPGNAPRLGQDGLDVGTASVAYLWPGKGWVLVSAHRPDHHTDVPHRLEGHRVRLSPDGTRLAYVYALTLRRTTPPGPKPAWRS